VAAAGRPSGRAVLMPPQKASVHSHGSSTGAAAAFMMRPTTAHRRAPGNAHSGPPFARDMQWFSCRAFGILRQANHSVHSSMSSLADAPDLVGFFSYSREDDEGSGGRLSKLRERIQEELRGSSAGRREICLRSRSQEPSGPSSGISRSGWPCGLFVPDVGQLAPPLP
jgi:hypothetical protein